MDSKLIIIQKFRKRFKKMLLFHFKNRRMRREGEVMKMLWKVKYEDLVFTTTRISSNLSKLSGDAVSILIQDWTRFRKTGVTIIYGDPNTTVNRGKHYRWPWSSSTHCVITYVKQLVQTNIYILAGKSLYILSSVTESKRNISKALFV